MTQITRREAANEVARALDLRREDGELLYWGTEAKFGAQLRAALHRTRPLARSPSIGDVMENLLLARFEEPTSGSEPTYRLPSGTLSVTSAEERTLARGQKPPSRLARSSRGLPWPEKPEGGRRGRPGRVGLRRDLETLRRLVTVASRDHVPERHVGRIVAMLVCLFGVDESALGVKATGDSSTHLRSVQKAIDRVLRPSRARTRA